MYQAQNYYMPSQPAQPGAAQGMEKWVGEITAPQPTPLAGNGVTGSVSNHQLQMKNQVPPEIIGAPTSTLDAYRGSLKAMLAKNEGNFIVATFMVGTQNTVSWEGILYDVGNDYVTIYQETRNRYIVSDIYSLKFMEFYDVQGQRLCREILEEQGLRNPIP